MSMREDILREEDKKVMEELERIRAAFKLECSTCKYKLRCLIDSSTRLHSDVQCKIQNAIDSSRVSK